MLIDSPVRGYCIMYLFRNKYVKIGGNVNAFDRTIFKNVYGNGKGSAPL